MTKIEWDNIFKSDHFNIEWEFEGMLCNYWIRMYEGVIDGETYWGALIRHDQSGPNLWGSCSMETQAIAENTLQKAVLLISVCKMIGYAI